jgi:superfamily I DNA/RNA helicase
VHTDVPVMTVHGVKGETHDITVFVCPDNTGSNHCPSTIWWSADEKDREEKRIAYVAMTRTQGDLILLVSDNCFERLRISRRPFVESFECLTVDEFIAEFAQSNLASLATAPQRDEADRGLYTG